MEELTPIVESISLGYQIVKDVKQYLRRGKVKLNKYLTDLAGDGTIPRGKIEPLTQDLYEFVDQIKKFPQKEYDKIGNNKKMLEAIVKVSSYFKSLSIFLKDRQILNGHEFLNFMNDIPSVLEFKDKHREIWNNTMKHLKIFIRMELDEIPWNSIAEVL